MSLIVGVRGERAAVRGYAAKFPTFFSGGFGVRDLTDSPLQMLNGSAPAHLQSAAMVGTMGGSGSVPMPGLVATGMGRVEDALANKRLLATTCADGRGVGSAPLGVRGAPITKPRGNSRGKWTPEEVRRGSGDERVFEPTSLIFRLSSPRGFASRGAANVRWRRRYPALHSIGVLRRCCVVRVASVPPVLRRGLVPLLVSLVCGGSVARGPPRAVRCRQRHSPQLPDLCELRDVVGACGCRAAGAA
jgi:hypothetical protein